MKLWPQYDWEKPSDWEMRCFAGVVAGLIQWSDHTPYMAARRAMHKAGCGRGINTTCQALLADLVGEPLRRALRVQGSPLVD